MSLSVNGGGAVAKALVSGVATFTKADIAALGNPNAGGYPLTATYAGNAVFDASAPGAGTLTVNQASVSILVTCPASVTYTGSPLTPCTASPNEFVAYQFHRPDLDSGIVLAFRRRDCAYRGLVLGLSAVRPQGQYEVEFINEAGERAEQTMTSVELAENLVLRLPETAAAGSTPSAAGRTR